MSGASSLGRVSMPAYTVPLLDSVVAQHGPRDLLARFFLAADQAAHEAGVSLQLNTDLATLVAANQAWAESWGAPLLPVFDPACSAVSAANAFWLSGHDKDGRVVATQAARCLDLRDGSLAQAMTSLRLFYADPAPRRAAGASCQVDCPPAHAITGTVAYSGGGWYHPDFRKRGLSRILPRLSRTLAHTRWATNATVSILKAVLIDKGVHRSYGYTKQAPGIRLNGAGRVDADFHLVWMDTAEMLADAEAYTEARAVAEPSQPTRVAGGPVVA